MQIMAWRRPSDKPSSELVWVCWRIYASLGLNELNSGDVATFLLGCVVLHLQTILYGVIISSSACPTWHHTAWFWFTVTFYYVTSFTNYDRLAFMMLTLMVFIICSHHQVVSVFQVTSFTSGMVSSVQYWRRNVDTVVLYYVLSLLWYQS